MSGANGRFARAVLILAAGALAVLGPPARKAHAHTYPSELTVRVNEFVDFSVTDPGSCSAFVSASSDDPNLATVTPDFGVGISVPFTVRAGSTPGVTYITLAWVGEDFGGEGPCQENVSGVKIKVNIVALPEETSAGSFPNSGSSGDPVNTWTGELYFHEAPDLDLGGPLPLFLRRYYASRMRIAFIAGDLGDNWRHNFEWKINTVGTVLWLTTGTGKVARYLKIDGEWVLQSTTDLPYEVLQAGQEFFVADPRSNLTYWFEATGRLKEIGDGKGNHLYLEYDGGSGKLASVADSTTTAEARELRFSHAGGHLTSVQEFVGGTPLRSVSYQYDGDDLVGFTDAAGNPTGYEYDGDHADPALLTAKVMPEGNRPWTQTYDAVGKVATQTDALGNGTSFDYGKPQTPGTTKVTRPDGKTWVHRHDGDGNLVEVTTPDGEVLRLGADGNRRRTTVQDPAGGTAAMSWDAASGRLASFTDNNGNATSWTYSPRVDPATGTVLHDLARVDHPDGTFETFTYDGSGNRLSRTDEAGHTWTWTYDAFGQPLTETNPEGGVATWTYDAFRNPATRTDPAGSTDTFVYDAHLRPVQVIHEDGSSQSRSFDPLNRTVGREDANGNAYALGYDDNGNRTSVTDPLGNRVDYAYDAMDRVVTATDPDGRASSVTWDSLGRFASKTDRAGATASNGYDLRDRMVRVTDQAGFDWTSAYDATGNLVASADPAGRTVTWERDAEGRLARAVTAAGSATRFSYDARDRLTRVVDGAGRPESFAYDPRGLLEEVSAGAGLATASFVHDGNGLLTSIVDGGGGTWTFARDSMGRNLSRTDPLGRTTTLAHDERHRVVSHTFPGGLGTLVLDHDAAGRILSRTFSDGTTLSYAYDANDLRTSTDGVSFAYDDRHLLATCNGVAVGRDPEGRIASVTLAPGKTVTYAYDGRGRVTAVGDWAGGGVTLTWDEAARPATLVRSNGVTTTFGFDDDNRLVSIAEGALATTLLERDGGGLVVAADRSVPLSPDLEAGEDPLLAFDAASQVDGFTYDALGRLTGDGTRTVQWDLASRATGIDDGSSPVDYDYDGFDMVLTRTEGGVTDSFTWNYAFPLPAISVWSRDGSPFRYLVHAPDGTLLYTVDASGGARRFFHYDEMGNTLFLTDDAGTVTDAYAYAPWGRLLDSTGSTENPFTWLGRHGVWAEDGAGLYRMRRRLYDAATRRFLSRDPLVATDPRSVNPYSYARGNPLYFVDPLGENPPAAGGVDPATAAGTGANVVSAFSEGLQWNVPGVGQYGWTRTGQTVKNVGNAAGTAATIFGAGLEVYNTNERMDRVSDRFLGEVEAAWEEYRRLRDIAWDLYSRKRRISYDRYREILRALMELREARLDRNRDRLWVDSLSVGTIATLNLLTNLIPGGGLVVDWSQHIQH